MSVLTLLLAFLRKSLKACFLTYFGCAEFKKVLSKLNFETYVVKNQHQNGRRDILMYSIMQSHNILDIKCSGVFRHRDSLETAL